MGGDVIFYENIYKFLVENSLFSRIYLSNNSKNS